MQTHPALDSSIQLCPPSGSAHLKQLTILYSIKNKGLLCTQSILKRTNLQEAVQILKFHLKKKVRSSWNFKKIPILSHTAFQLCFPRYYVLQPASITLFISYYKWHSNLNICKVLSILSKFLSKLNSHQLQMERRGLRSTLQESFLSTFKFNSILRGVVLWGHQITLHI